MQLFHWVSNLTEAIILSVQWVGAHPDGSGLIQVEPGWIVLAVAVQWELMGVEWELME